MKTPKPLTKNEIIGYLKTELIDQRERMINAKTPEDIKIEYAIHGHLFMIMNDLGLIDK